jgi:TDG/mug DNA glycosylase family protein
VSRPWKPTKADIAAAAGKTVSDVIAPGLEVLFCGINPGLYSGAVGHHFARPGNRFWPALRGAGFTDRLLSPFEEKELLAAGCGITNLVDRATGAADELSEEELTAGGRRLAKKVHRHNPQCVAFLGISAYRTAFSRKKATSGKQTERIGEAMIWVLPNPSGLNAHHRLADLVEMFAQLREALKRKG